MTHFYATPKKKICFCQIKKTKDLIIHKKNKITKTLSECKMIAIIESPISWITLTEIFKCLKPTPSSLSIKKHPKINNSRTNRTPPNTKTSLKCLKTLLCRLKHLLCLINQRINITKIYKIMSFLFKKLSNLKIIKLKEFKSN